MSGKKIKINLHTKADEELEKEVLEDLEIEDPKDAAAILNTESELNQKDNE